jgi:hypothetical protein
MARSRRHYDHCAKGGHEKESSPTFVCAEHHGTPGLYTHCAVCGEELDGGPTRDYVCIHDLVYDPVPRPELVAS